jgi:hypothetical protein
MGEVILSKYEPNDEDLARLRALAGEPQPSLEEVIAEQIKDAEWLESQTQNRPTQDAEDGEQ